MPDPFQFHGFMLYVIVGAVTFPIWGPAMMVFLFLYLIWMIAYGFIFAPIRWVVLGIRTGDWDPDNFQRPRSRPTREAPHE